MKDMSYLKGKPIVILGGGAAGRTHAVDCKLGGAEVRMYENPEFAKGLGEILQNKTLKLEGPQWNANGFERSGIAVLDMVTTDMKEAMEGAGNVIVAMPALGFDLVIERMMPYLEDGMVVHFPTGNFGSLLLRHKMKEAGIKKDIIVGEWSSQPYGTRIKSMAGVNLPVVNVLYRAITLKAAALPHTDTDALIAAKEYIPSFDAVVKPVKGDTVLDICFTNVNPVLHCPGTILGVSTMENFGTVLNMDKYQYSIYSHAFCPSVSEVQYAFWKEEYSIAKAIGFEMEEYPKELFFSRSNVLGPEFLGPECKGAPFEERYEPLETTGPFDIYNRYITEDIPVGCCLRSQLAKKFGVDCPVIDSMITLASVMVGKDFRNNCWTLEKLGIADLSKEELMAYVR